MIDVAILLSLLIYREVPPQDAQTMVCIAKHESSLRPKAINKKLNQNKTKDYGLFQINDVWLEECDVTSHQLLEVNYNVLCAVHVYKTQGLEAWATYKKCQRSS